MNTSNNLSTSSYPIPSQESIDSKIITDLNLLIEKMDLCESMLKRGSGEPAISVRNDETTILSLVGFMEACAPRLVELIEAGAQGAFSEPVLMQCLDVNDRLTRLFNEVDTAAWIETSGASTTAASLPASASTTATSTPQMEDLLFDINDDDDIHQHGTKSSSEQDPLGLFHVGSSGAATNKNISEINSSKSEDEFDSFFNQRTGGSS